MSNCQFCGEKFKRKTVNQKYCSKTCKTKSYYKEYKCIWCGTIFYSKHPDSRFCSNSCSAKYRYKDSYIELTCTRCKTLFSRKKGKVKDTDKHFCSVKCRRAGLDSLKGKESHRYNSQECSCKTCGEVFYRQLNQIKSRSMNFCSHECYSYWLSENRSGEDSPSYRGSPIHYQFKRGSKWLEIAESIRKRDDYTCQQCGAPQKGKTHEVHHKVPYRFFDDDLLANSDGNLITLCSTCHRKQKSHWWHEVPKEYKHLLIKSS
jgi:5-methylcytosine-specific restriction endonuclease McrA